MGTRRRNYKHGDQKTPTPEYNGYYFWPHISKTQKIFLFYQYIIYKYLMNNSIK